MPWRPTTTLGTVWLTAEGAGREGERERETDSARGWKRGEEEVVGEGEEEEKSRKKRRREKRKPRRREMRQERTWRVSQKREEGGFDMSEEGSEEAGEDCRRKGRGLLPPPVEARRL
ncbi:hypothetical protein MLD38_004583 [Melastoma candidum]|uniref:Uncharacterized protein n=1 Tax=Melastoma candidum TaxID=119954 RepID=A0ACB9S5M6_9MYRT|nr:hypothetical protein MLD38_004583 [Melastoma candidum]